VIIQLRRRKNRVEAAATANKVPSMAIPRERERSLKGTSGAWVLKIRFVCMWGVGRGGELFFLDCVQPFFLGAKFRTNAINKYV
jgi:hypothetical protein